MKSGRAFSSRPVSLSVQKSLFDLPFKSPFTRTSAERVLPQRQHHLVDDISIDGLRMILPLCSATKALPSLSSSSCLQACALQSHLRFHQAEQMRAARAHVKRSSRIAWGPYSMSYRCRPLLRAASSLLLEIAGCVLLVRHRLRHRLLRVESPRYTLLAIDATVNAFTSLSGAGNRQSASL